jgi:hypothetical protein
MPRRFQFSLRPLLVTMAVLAAPCAWVAHNARMVRQREATRLEFWVGGDLSCFLPIGENTIPFEQHLPWLRRVLGDDIGRVLLYMPDGDQSGSKLLRVRSLFPEAEIWAAPNYDSELPLGGKRFPF